MPIDSVIHTNKHSIDRVLGAGLPVVLAFWDHNHMTVKASDSELDKLAAKYAGRALIAKVDAEEESELLSRYQVGGVPSFAFIKDGSTIERTQVDDPSYVDAWLRHLTGDGPQPARPAQTGNGASANGTAEAAHGSAAQAATNADGKPVTLTDANFHNITSGATPVLVDFWAAWCGPCRMVAPSVEALAQEFDGRAIVGKLNVEENQRTASQFGVRSIPTLLIFKNGKVVDQIVGAQPLPVLRQHLAAHA